MTDIAFTLPAEKSQARPGSSRAITATVQSALTYAAFCTSITFSLALVFGVLG